MNSSISLIYIQNAHTFLLVTQSRKVIIQCSLTFVALQSHNQSLHKQRPSMQPSSWSGSSCSPLLSECGQLYKTIKGKTRDWHAHILSTIGRYFRSGPGKQLFMSWQQVLYMPYTSHIKRTHTRTHTHLTSGYCVCVQTMRACVSFFPVQAHSDLSRPDLGLFLARPPGLRHLQRDTENTMKTGSQFLDDQKKKKKKRVGGEMACLVLQPQ